jgi:hypothetical protein
MKHYLIRYRRPSTIQFPVGAGWNVNSGSGLHPSALYLSTQYVQYKYQERTRIYLTSLANLTHFFLYPASVSSHCRHFAITRQVNKIHNNM